MAKAKAKVEQTPQERVNEFAALVQAASDQTGIGLGLRILWEPSGAKPDLYYIDIVEAEKKKAEAAKSNGQDQTQ
jgi:hypothetical protein